MKTKTKNSIGSAILTLITLILTSTASAQVNTGIVAIGSFPKSAIPNITDAISVKAGDGFGLALRENGEVAGFTNTAFPDNRAANFTKADCATYGATRVVAIDCGLQHSAFVLDNGKVVTRGLNAANRVGQFPFAGINPTSNYSVLGFATTYNATVVYYYDANLPISSGRFRLTAWGDINGGSTAPRMLPAIPSGGTLKPWANTDQITAMSGGSNFLAIVTNGVMTGFGVSTFGQGILLANDPHNTNISDVYAGNGYSWIIVNGNAYGNGFNHAWMLPSGSYQNVVGMAGGESHEIAIFQNYTASGAMFQNVSSSVGQENVPQWLGGIVYDVACKKNATLLLVEGLPQVTSTVLSVVSGVTTTRYEWPSFHLGYMPLYGGKIEVTTDLVNFSSLNVTPTLVGGNWRIELSTSGDKQYLRLRSPIYNN